jgi:hypothetical protein
MRRAPIEMVEISKGRVVKAFDWRGFGLVCIALALMEEMQRGVYTTVSYGTRKRTR